jgi:hypothetical protein
MSWMFFPESLRILLKLGSPSQKPKKEIHSIFEEKKLIFYRKFVKILSIKNPPGSGSRACLSKTPVSGSGFNKSGFTTKE